MSLQSDAREFARELLRGGMDKATIALRCKVPMQVVYAIFSDERYDMGTLNARHILHYKLTHTKEEKYARDRKQIERLTSGYKGNRAVNPPRRGSRLDELKRL